MFFVATVMLTMSCWGQSDPEVGVQVWIGPNCPACEHFKLTLAEIQAEGWPIVVSNTAEYPDQAAKAGVRSIPATLVYNRDRYLLRCIGAASADWLRAVFQLSGVRRGPHR